MRVEFVHTATGQANAVELPEKLNPVWIGHHPRNHVVLPDAESGPEAIAIDNDVAGGAGWRVWNRTGRLVQVAGVPLHSRNQYTSVSSRRVSVDCPPYVLTLLFTASETATEADEAISLERDCGELVREVHRELIELHPRDSLDPSEAILDGYLHNLEQEIVDLAERRADFPSDDRFTTTLGFHFAGVALRSAVISNLIASSTRDGAKVNVRPEPNWKRYRSVIPECENFIVCLAQETVRLFRFSACQDLTTQMETLEREFWSVWKSQLSSKVTPRMCRYLARKRLIKEVKDIWYGFGPLEDLMEDPSITEIMVLDADRIFIEKDNRIERSGRRFLSDPLTIAQRILAQANRQINAANPLADARMPDGSRVNVIIPPLALSGPTITIRRFPPHRITADELVDRGALSVASKNFLKAAVGNRRNIIVTGGTGSGKTTMLNCLSQYIGEKERIVTVEDTAELQLRHRHVVTLQSRPKGLEGTGAIGIRDLVRNSLRMRPDRIVVGECRGGEAIDMLQAMNTGHDGSMTTLHANDPRAAIARLVVLVQQDSDTDMPVATILEQIAGAVDIIVHLGELLRDGKRFKVVREVVEVVAYDADRSEVILNPLFSRHGDGPLMPSGHLPTFLPSLIERGLISDPVSFLSDGGES